MWDRFYINSSRKSINNKHKVKVNKKRDPFKVNNKKVKDEELKNSLITIEEFLIEGKVILEKILTNTELTLKDYNNSGK